MAVGLPAFRPLKWRKKHVNRRSGGLCSEANVLGERFEFNYYSSSHNHGSVESLAPQFWRLNLLIFADFFFHPIFHFHDFGRKSTPWKFKIILEK